MIKEKKLHGKKFVFMALCLCLLWGCGAKAGDESVSKRGNELKIDVSFDSEMLFSTDDVARHPLEIVLEEEADWDDLLAELETYVGKEENLSGESGNAFFFPVSSGEATKTVYCVMMGPYVEYFGGAATLHIEEIEELAGEGHYYKVWLSDFVGRCTAHSGNGKSELEDFPCYFFEEDKYTQGKQYYYDTLYFYVEDDSIYQTFPGSEEILLEGGSEVWKEHVPRLVCKEEGVKETVDDSFMQYHEGVDVDGEERRYFLYPQNNSGTYEHQHITFTEGKGITYYSDFAGALKSLVGFSDSQDILEYVEHMFQ